MVTSDKLLETSNEEFEFREALEALLGIRSDISDLERPIIVTPYDGAYGRAGFVLTIDGSPPRALVHVTATYNQPYVFVFRRPYRPGPVIEIEPPVWRETRSKKKVRFYNAVLKYLEVNGYLKGK